MNQSAKTFGFNDKGMSLIEILASIVIFSIAIAAISGVFLMGLKAFKKVGIEGQLRDEADYIVTRIMNEIYTNPPDYIIDCSTPSSEKSCIRIVDEVEVGTEEIIINDGGDKYIDIDPDKDKSSKKIIEYKIDSTNININSEIINSNKIDLTSSELYFLCLDPIENTEGKCQNAVININLKLQHVDYKEDSLIEVKPVYLESKFGL